MAVGFSIFENRGQRIKDRHMPRALFKNSRGYINSKSITLDTSIKPSNVPYTLLMSTFDPSEEAKFTFTLWYKKSQGTVTIKEF